MPMTWLSPAGLSMRTTERLDDWRASSTHSSPRHQRGCTPPVAWRTAMNNVLAKHTGQKLDKIERDVERDFIMNAQQGKEYGIIDEIIYQHK